MAQRAARGDPEGEPGGGKGWVHHVIRTGCLHPGIGNQLKRIKMVKWDSLCGTRTALKGTTALQVSGKKT